MRPADLADPDLLAWAARRVRPLRDEAPLGEAEAAALGRVLAGELARGTWRPAPADLFSIPKPGRPGERRTLARLARRDRVVQRAALTLLERRLPGLFPPPVHGYVRGRSALGVVAWLERRLRAPGAWAWSLDVVDFFPSLRHDRLRRAIHETVDEPCLQAVLEAALTHPVRERGRVRPSRRGVLQGALLSPWLSNLYLRDVDAARPPAWYRRYCDNLFVVGDRHGVEAAARALASDLATLGLQVRARPATPRPAAEGIPCLGYHVDAAGRRPTRAAARRLLERLARRVRDGDAPRAAALLRGHRAYYGHHLGELLMDIDELLRAGRFREALEHIEAARRRFDDAGDDVALTDEDVDELLDHLRGDPERFAELDDGPLRRVVPRRLGPDDLADHRRGARSLGVLPVDRAGWAHVGVFDVDGERGEKDDTRRDAAALAGAARADGLGAIIEDTGGRGHHVWMPFATPLPSDDAHARLERLARRAGPAPPTVRRELFPAPPDADPSIRLPLGRHPRTGRRSAFVDAAGRPMRDGPSILAALRAPSPAEHRPVIRDAGVRAVLEGCPLLRSLADRAAATGHLNHHERYSLAAALAPLGPGGVEAVHAIIACCDNYDHEVTRHFIERLSPRPMGCARLRERHPDLALDCQCPSAGGGLAYPCPLRFARLRRGGEPPPDPSADDLERLIRGLRRSLARVRGEEGT